MPTKKHRTYFLIEDDLWRSAVRLGKFTRKKPGAALNALLHDLQPMIEASIDAAEHAKEGRRGQAVLALGEVVLSEIAGMLGK